ncbi:hypothetical protein BJ741DRAFT_584235 [Chytriomyces cf. hyalinus JEL632]|nr:hypothetical protein BJ741DRAFT_584235 [Chytriomyces cf. hyalinus JEL632]
MTTDVASSIEQTKYPTCAHVNHISDLSSQMRLQNQTLSQPLLPFAGCFQEQSVGNPFPFNKPYSDAEGCVQFCQQPGPDNPKFLILHRALEPQCACSSGCSLVQVGSDVQRVLDELCSNACPDNSTLMCGGRDSNLGYFAVYSLTQDSSNCAENVMLAPMNRPVLIISFVAIFIAACLFCVLIYFIISEANEMRTFSVIVWRDVAISPFNIQLFLMTASLLGFYSCVIHETWLLVGTTAYIVPLNFFFSATFKTVYLQHSWMRASVVINSISSLAANCIRICLYTVPIVMYAVTLPAISFVVSLSRLGDGLDTMTQTSQEWMRIIETISIILMASVDLALLICFVLHICRNTRGSDEAPIEQKFMTISYFGVVANVLCCVAFVVQIEQVATVVVLSRFPVHQVLVDVGTHLVFTAVLLTLVAMKVVVRHADRREITTRRMTLEQNLLKHGILRITSEDKN